MVRSDILKRVTHSLPAAQTGGCTTDAARIKTGRGFGVTRSLTVAMVCDVAVRRRGSKHVWDFESLLFGDTPRDIHCAGTTPRDLRSDELGRPVTHDKARWTAPSHRTFS